MTLFLKKMWIILSTSKPHCHSRLNKPALKILSICRRNTLWEQLSQAIRFQIASCTRISNIFYKIKYDGQSCQTVHEKALINLIGKRQCRSLFFDKVSCLQAKERLLHRFFLWVLPNVLIRFFCKTHPVTASAKYPNLSDTLTSTIKKCFLPNWLFLIFSRQTLWIVCEQVFLEFLDSQSAVTKLIYC